MYSIHVRQVSSTIVLVWPFNGCKYEKKETRHHLSFEIEIATLYYMIADSTLYVTYVSVTTHIQYKLNIRNR